MTKRKKWSFSLAIFPLVLVLIGLCSIFLVEPPIARAAGARVAHPASTTLQHASSAAPTQNNAIIPNPFIINGRWFCPRPFIAYTQVVPLPGTGGGPPVKTHNVICVRGGLFFPCSDILDTRNGIMWPNQRAIRGDWLSGDVPFVTGTTRGMVTTVGGHLIYTFTNEIYKDNLLMQTLFGYMMGLAFLLITPSVLLLAYQVVLAASTFRYAGALEGFSHVLLGAVSIGASFTLIQMLVNFQNILNAGILLLHAQYPFPQTTVNGIPVPYRLPGDPPASYRGIVVPMTRWGCAVNNFVGIFSVPFVANTLASVIPLLKDLTHLAGAVTSMADLAHRVGQMILTVLSMLLWVQVFIRVVLLKYYVLTAPLAFGCWALPGGVGQRVVRLWCKGFFSVLFLQVLQLFILTTLPLLLPTLPQIPADSVGLLQGFLLQFPPILTLCVVLMAPRLMGASAAKAFGTAGSMAGGVVVAVGAAASRMV